MLTGAIVYYQPVLPARGGGATPAGVSLSLFTRAAPLSIEPLSTCIAAEQRPHSIWSTWSTAQHMEQATYVARELEVLLEEGLDGTNVLPVAIEWVRHHVHILQGGKGGNTKQGRRERLNKQDPCRGR